MHSVTAGLASIEFSGLNLLLIASPKVEESLIVAGVLLSLVTIYLASKLGGELSYRLKLPSVLGELVGGVLVGVSCLHLLMFAGAQVSSSSLLITVLQTTAGLESSVSAPAFEIISEIVNTLAEIGVIILLFEIGLESNLKELLKVGPQATIVAAVGVILPFGLGTAGLMLLFHLPAIPAIFAGAALTATSIGITSKVLSELGHLNSPEGQVILGAAIVDDVFGVIILAVVASLAKTGTIDVGQVTYLFLAAIAFLLGAIGLGNFFNKSFSKIVEALKTRGSIVIPAFIFAFLLAYLATAIHLEAILGAFAAGLVLEETDAHKALKAEIMPIADLFVPIFFVVVGAKTDISVLNPWVPSNREGLVIASFLVIVAIVGKVATAAVVSQKQGMNRLAIGVGMIPRGEVGLVFLGVGTTIGILPDALQAAIVVMVIVTTFLAPPLLRWILPQPPRVETDEPALPG
jgi:Kef-type K+ transport system membrane component KefB